MHTLGNILWHIPFLGFITAFLTFVTGSLLTLCVIPAPIGLGLIQYSKFLLMPFSYEMVPRKELNVAEQSSAWKTWSNICMVLYLPFGVLAVILTAIQIVLLFVTIIGIPAAMVLAKSLGTYLNPVNKICVPRAVGMAIQQQKDQAQVEKYLGKKDS